MQPNKKSPEQSTKDLIKPSTHSDPKKVVKEQEKVVVKKTSSTAIEDETVSERTQVSGLKRLTKLKHKEEE